MHLIFVYNAKSGYINAVLDSLHKVVSPTTYQCKLCELTHGVFKERREWQDFMKETKHELEFLHKDEFEERFEEKLSYPCVLIEKQANFNVLISKEQLEVTESIDNLINEIKNITT